MEPLNLQYKIYERASKKLKLDLDGFSGGETCVYSEDMPKLEPSVGNGANVSSYASLDASGDVLEYKCAPLLRAYETSDYDASCGRNEEASKEGLAKEEPSKVVETVSGKAQPADPEVRVSGSSPEVKGEVALKNETSAAPASAENAGSGQPGLSTQGSVSDSDGSLSKGNLSGESCDSNLRKVTGVTSSNNNFVDTYLTYTRAYPAPSNGVNVGVTFIPSEMGFISPAGVPCTIIPTGGCVPVSGDCLPGGINVPTVCSGVALQRPLEGESAAANHVNVWVAPALTNLVTEQPSVLHNVESKLSVADAKDGEDEGKEVQLTISESGIMSASGRGTTVEGVVNPLESDEACELLSKIESGSLVEEFLTKNSEKQTSKAKGSKVPAVMNRKTKNDAKSLSTDNLKNKVDVQGNVVNKNPVSQMSEALNGVPVVDSAQAVSHNKTNNISSRDSVETVSDQTESHGPKDSSAKKKTSVEGHDKVADKKALTEHRTSNEIQHKTDSKESSSAKDLKSSHIPASLTAASMANLNKPHLKAGPSKAGQVEEVKNRESKPNNSGLNVKKDGKQEASGKPTPPPPPPSGSCRKSSQPYGYKTLKTPPKSWNPTISREHLALGAAKSSGNKGVQEHSRPNKFFKARNNPRYQGNTTVGVKPAYPCGNDGSNLQKQGVVLKIDPKTLAPVTSVPVSNDIRASGCLTSSMSSLAPPVSSALSTTQPATQTTSSAVGSLPLSSDGLTTLSSSASSSQSCSMESSASIAAPKETAVTSTKTAPTLPTSLKSVTKESTNLSSKVIGKYNAPLQEGEVALDNDKTASSSSAGRVNKPNDSKNSIAVKHENISNAQSSVSNSKVDSVGLPDGAKETKVSMVMTGQPLNTAGNAMPHYDSSKPSLPLTVPTCVTQLKSASMNTLTASGGGYQAQQSFAVGSPAVGLIPSSGISLPATIGSMPLPYYTSPSLGYSTYPYVYQSPEAAAIGLIPPHPPASFISTFPPCLSPRSPLSPRGIAGTKMLPDLPLQTNLLPLVPLVPQVPPQALSPRPMTPPSPKTPTSNQSQKTYSSQAVRQSSTTMHSRPLTPHSPLTPSLGYSKSPAQSPKLPSGQPAKAQTGVPLTQFNSQPVSQTLTSSSQSSNVSSKLNACVQTSFSQTLTLPKNNLSFVTSPKPALPHNAKNSLSNTQSLAISQQMTSLANCYPNTCHSPKPSRPKTPQPSSLTSSLGCTLSTETVSKTGAQAHIRPQVAQIPKCSSPQSSKCFTPLSSPDTRTTNVTTSRMAASSQEHLQTTISQASVLSMPFPVSHLTAVIPSGSYNVPHMSSGLESASVLQSQASLGNLTNTIGAVSQSGVGNLGAASATKGLVTLPVASSAVSSSYLPNYSLSSSLPQCNVQNVSSIMTTGVTAISPAATSNTTCVSTLPTCAALTQNFHFSSCVPCTNPLVFSNTFPPPLGQIPSSSVAEMAKVSSVMSVSASGGSGTGALCGTVNTSSPISATCKISGSGTTCASGSVSTSLGISLACKASPSNPSASVGGSCVTATRSSTTVTSVSYTTKPLPTGMQVSWSQGLTTFTVPSSLGTTTVPSAASVNPSGNASPAVVTSVSKVEGGGPQGTVSSVDVHTSSVVASTYPLSTSGNAVVPASSGGSCASSLNGTMDATFPPGKMQETSDSTAKVSQSQICGTVSGSGSGGSSGGDGLSSGSDLDGKSAVTSIKERSGNAPQPSACTPVCDVTHVIDAKLPCAELSVSNSDGPRPCLKS